jgi:hypothetical protein
MKKSVKFFPRYSLSYWSDSVSWSKIKPSPAFEAAFAVKPRVCVNKEESK